MEKTVFRVLLVVFLIVLIVGLFVQGKNWWQQVRSPSTSSGTIVVSLPTILATDPALGPAQAPVTIVEFGDYTCEACTEAQTELKKAASEFPGLVRIVWKDFPVSLIRAESVSAAVAARCAGRQGKFAEYQDALFRGQGLLTEQFFPAVAKSLNLNEELFSQCRQDLGIRSQVLASRQEGIDLGIDGVPYFFLNNQRINQVLSAELWRENIQKALQ